MVDSEGRMPGDHGYDGGRGGDNPVVEAPAGESAGLFGGLSLLGGVREAVRPTRYTSGGLPLLSKKGDSRDNFAQVTLASWNDFKTNFAPYREMMFKGLTTENPGIVKASVNQAQQQVGRSFDNAENNRQVTMSRLGMAPDAQMQRSVNRQSALKESAALAGAANKTRGDLKERDMTIMTTGMPNVAGRAYGMKGE